MKPKLILPVIKLTTVVVLLNVVLEKIFYFITMKFKQLYHRIVMKKFLSKSLLYL